IGLWRPNQKKISSQGPYVASSFSPVFHHSSCRSAQRIAQKNKQYFQTPKGAIQTGRRPCKICNP
ncbi:hypothetical protein HYW31_01250, partial [Candidatus Berkelbacteria bacterium]|nr:hypothetical protein [Candidatus Berkelbacteria bacterium]